VPAALAELETVASSDEDDPYGASTAVTISLDVLTSGGTSPGSPEELTLTTVDVGEPRVGSTDPVETEESLSATDTMIAPGSTGAISAALPSEFARLLSAAAVEDMSCAIDTMTAPGSEGFDAASGVMDTFAVGPGINVASTLVVESLVGSCEGMAVEVLIEGSSIDAGGSADFDDVCTMLSDGMLEAV